MAFYKLVKKEFKRVKQVNWNMLTPIILLIKLIETRLGIIY